VLRGQREGSLRPYSRLSRPDVYEKTLKKHNPEVELCPEDVTTLMDRDKREVEPPRFSECPVVTISENTCTREIDSHILVNNSVSIV
jgi:hypothetical protein